MEHLCLLLNTCLCLCSVFCWFVCLFIDLWVLYFKLLIKYFFNILLWNFKHMEKLKEFYTEHPYSYDLESTLNIFVLALSSIYPSLYPCTDRSLEAWLAQGFSHLFFSWPLVNSLLSMLACPSWEAAVERENWTWRQKTWVRIVALPLSWANQFTLAFFICKTEAIMVRKNWVRLLVGVEPKDAPKPKSRRGEGFITRSR